MPQDTTNAPYVVESGRHIVCHGVHVALLTRIGNDHDGYAITPVEADDLVKRIVRLLNAEVAQLDTCVSTLPFDATVTCDDHDWHDANGNIHGTTSGARWA